MLTSTRSVIALTVVLAAVFAASGWLDAGIGDQPLARELALVAINTLPLLALRRNPLAVVVVFSIAYPTWVDLGHPTHELQSLPTLVAMYALGAWDRSLWLRAIGLATPVWMLGAAVYGLWDVDPLQLSFVGLMFVVVWGLGVVVAGRRAYVTELEARTAELLAARQELAERAVADERARIARELHDVIAHAMSVITVQAGVGAHLVDRHPEQAGASLQVIETTGREALSEMRRLLAVLREPDGHGPPPEPQPGLADLPRLVAQAGDAGVHLAYTTRGDAHPLSAGHELAIFRIVQEALTNMAKHAPGTRGSVTVDYRPDGVEVELSNALPADRLDDPVTPGQGLRGMAERVALYGGQLETTAEGGTFRVRARLPRQETT